MDTTPLLPKTSECHDLKYLCGEIPSQLTSFHVCVTASEYTAATPRTATDNCYTKHCSLNVLNSVQQHAMPGNGTGLFSRQNKASAIKWQHPCKDVATCEVSATTLRKLNRLICSPSKPLPCLGGRNVSGSNLSGSLLTTNKADVDCT